MIELILALACILAPTNNEAPIIEPTEGLMLALQYLGVEMELIDRRENRILFLRPEDFQSDLGTIRRRYAELRDAPPLCDSQRLPSPELVSDYLAFNRRLRQHLEAQVELSNEERADAFLQAIVEVDRRHELWDAIRDARGEYYYVTVRRHAMLKVRKMVGEKAYAEGRFPCHVPLYLYGIKE